MRLKSATTQHRLVAVERPIADCIDDVTAPAPAAAAARFVYC